VKECGLDPGVSDNETSVCPRGHESNPGLMKRESGAVATTISVMQLVARRTHCGYKLI
jgi:hypothetical protein